jgi:hypothetical protein
VRRHLRIVVTDVPEAPRFTNASCALTG